MWDGSRKIREAIIYNPYVDISEMTMFLYQVVSMFAGAQGGNVSSRT